MEDLLQLYKKLYSSTEEQRALIEKGDFDGLLQLLEDKDRLIEKIDRRDLKSYINGKEEPAEVYGQIKEFMEKTKELEDKNIALLKEKSTDIREKMQDLSQKESRRKKYNKKADYEAKFIDKKS